MIAVLKPLSTAELLDKIFSLYRNRFFLFAGIMALPHAVGLLSTAYTLYVWSSSIQSVHNFQLVDNFTGYSRAYVSGLISGYISDVSILLGSAAAVFAASRVYLQQPVRILMAYRSVLLRSLGFVAIGGIAIYISRWSTILRWPGYGGYWGWGYGGFGIVVFSLIATRLIPTAVDAFCLLLFPVALLEKLNPARTLVRSLRLFEKRIGRLVLVVILGLSISLALSWGSQILTAILFSLHAAPAESLWLVGTFSRAIAGTISGPILPIGLVLAYYDARLRNEAFDLELMMNTVTGTPAILNPTPSGSEASSAQVGKTE
jgi:hypothetical protein